MQSHEPVPTAKTPRRATARLGYGLLAGWVIAVVGLYIFVVVSSRMSVSGSELLIVAAAAVLVPLFVYALWRFLLRFLAVFTGGR